MHYIRLLRPPKVAGSGARQLELLFTITTDLGDSFLFLDEFLELQVTAYVSTASGVSAWALSAEGQVVWKPGSRVAKPRFHLPGGLQKVMAARGDVEICVSAASRYSADGVGRLLAAAGDADGLIMPVWAKVAAGGDDVDVSTRKLLLRHGSDGPEYIEVEEEIGESIARHIWDAGVVALCAIAGSCISPQGAGGQPCMTAVKEILGRQQLRVLELGCGVGILGAGLSTVLPLVRPELGDCTILMTDLEEAEDRANSNIRRLRRGDGGTDGHVQLLYENLDWEDARKGQFGPRAQASCWDLVMLSDCTYNVDMLPALVETLSAVHSSNSANGEGELATNVFLATKPRHESERVLFPLMAGHGWSIREKLVLPLPVLGAESESVEMYLFAKS